LVTATSCQHCVCLLAVFYAEIINNWMKHDGKGQRKSISPRPRLTPFTKREACVPLAIPEFMTNNEMGDIAE
jgi:hypothetical protein